MKSQVYDRFGSGLLVLVMLAIAVVASEAQPGFQEPGPAIEAIEPKQPEESAAPLADSDDAVTDSAR
jgi:hypothetical protein